MGRPKKKPGYDPEKIMEQFTNCIAEAYMSGAGGESANSLRQISEQFSITLILIDRKRKAITRSSVDIALKEAMEMKGIVNGPKKLKVFGASYLYPIFLRFGLIKMERE